MSMESVAAKSKGVGGKEVFKSPCKSVFYQNLATCRVETMFHGGGMVHRTIKPSNKGVDYLSTLMSSK